MTKCIVKGVGQRLSAMETFDATKGMDQEQLNKAGYTEELKFEPREEEGDEKT